MGILGDNVFSCGAFLKSQLTPSAESKPNRCRFLCVCVYLCICFCVFVVTLHRCPARRCQKPAIGNTFDLQMKKKHTRTFPKIDTPTEHTDTGVCVSRGDDLQLNRRVVGRLRSFLQNTSRGNTSVYSPRTRHLPVLFLVINRRQWKHLQLQRERLY